MKLQNCMAAKNLLFSLLYILINYIYSKCLHSLAVTLNTEIKKTIAINAGAWQLNMKLYYNGQ